MKPKDIRNIVEHFLNIDITKKTRKREYVYARALYWKLCRKYTSKTLDELAYPFWGGCNHATVLNAIGDGGTFDQAIKYDYAIKMLWENFNKIKSYDHESQEKKYNTLLLEHLALLGEAEAESVEEETRRNNDNFLSDNYLEKYGRFVKLIDRVPSGQMDLLYERMDSMTFMVSKIKQVS